LPAKRLIVEEKIVGCGIAARGEHELFQQYASRARVFSEIAAASPGNCRFSDK
jgi:hypothetical protein